MQEGALDVHYKEAYTVPYVNIEKILELLNGNDAITGVINKRVLEKTSQEIV